MNRYYNKFINILCHLQKTRTTVSSRSTITGIRSGFVHQSGGIQLRKHTQQVHHRVTHKSAVIDDFDLAVTDDFESLIPRTDEPNLFNLPSTLYPEYRAIPIPLKLISSLMIIFVSIKRHSRPAKILNRNAAAFLRFLAKTFLAYLLCTLATQEFLYAPSRIDTASIVQNKWLPSSLSKYSIVNAGISPLLSHHGDDNIEPIGVHFLEYQNSATNYKFDAIHFNHGFGASSLSWLPALPDIVNRLGGRVGVAHDSPGFGFTDRPPTTGVKDSLMPYSATGSASLGNALLTGRLQENIGVSKNSEGPFSEKRVALFGHSMGCASTLRMAIALPSNVEKVVILVAPALVGKLPSKSARTSLDPSYNTTSDLEMGSLATNSSLVSKIRLWLGILIASLRKVLIDPFLMYLLRRLVGQAKFWSKGLRLAVSNPDSVTESDSLRYQWPSIGRGWERGLLAFTRSRLTSTCIYSGREFDLLQDVLNIPNTKVVIVHGSKDRIIPLDMSRKIADVFDKVNFVEMPGKGHNIHEENVEEFIETIETTI